MNPILFGQHYIFLYQSILDSKAPILKEIYCKSHQFEPWAILGESWTLGQTPFENVLYVNQFERDELLAQIPKKLISVNNYAHSILLRSYQEAKQLLKLIQHPDQTPYHLAAALESGAKVLSVGIFKEKLKPAWVIKFLADFLPVSRVESCILPLYQPLGFSHLRMFELKSLFWAEQWLNSRRNECLDTCIRQCSYLSQFCFCHYPLNDPKHMRQKLEQVITDHNQCPKKIKDRRQHILQQHRQAVRNSHDAAQSILAIMDECGCYQLRSKLAIMNLIKLIQFMATFEEIKRILIMRLGWHLNRHIKDLNLEVEHTTSQILLSHLAEK